MWCFVLGREQERGRQEQKVAEVQRAAEERVARGRDELVVMKAELSRGESRPAPLEKNELIQNEINELRTFV
jgi:hypothetical protein